MKTAERKRSDQPDRSSGLQKALQESEKRFRQVVSGGDCAIFLLP
jgi:hypothetical protein